MLRRSITGTKVGWGREDGVAVVQRKGGATSICSPTQAATAGVAAAVTAAGGNGVERVDGASASGGEDDEESAKR